MTARRRVIIQKALGADHDLQVAETSRRGHAARLARGAAAEGVDVVVVLAGDGTLNEAADGLVGTDTAIAPSRAQAKKYASQAGMLGSQSATRSPGPTPRSASPRAARSARSCNSPKETVRSP